MSDRTRLQTFVCSSKSSRKAAFFQQKTRRTWNEKNDEKRVRALSLRTGASGTAFIEFFTFSANAETIDAYAQGDLVTFGWYPQTKVMDSDMVDTLNAQSAAWRSYGYYIGTGSYSDGYMVPSGYMEYTDVIYGVQQYRGVRFSQYRPYYTGFKSSAAATFQDENGYDQPGSTYWFQWEPLQWCVLDPAAGLVLCETIIDSQPYHNYVLSAGTDAYGEMAYWGNAGKTYYANNYAESSLRQWLNNSFLGTAFSLSQQDIIAPATLDNSAYSASYSAYDSAPATDKIFLLSFSDILNTAYGFDVDKWADDPARQAQGSDYAKCQGLYVNVSDGYSRWWLRSAGYYSDHVRSIDFDGCVFDRYNGTSNANFGVRPALQLDLTAEIFQSDVSEVGSKRVAGDADGDCTLTLKDVVVIRRLLADDCSVDETNADVNGDGSVTLKDAVLIERYLVGGWDVVLL